MLSALDFCEVSFAVSAVSISLTRSHITNPLRDRADRWPYLLKELLSCPYCMSHWIAGIFAVEFSHSIMGWIINTFALVGASSLITGLILKLWLWSEAELERVRGKLHALISEVERRR